MPIVLLGNHTALDHQGNALEGQRVTSINLPDSDTHREHVRTITHDDGLWNRLATGDAVWVASDNERLAHALATHFGCPSLDMDEGRARLEHARRTSELEAAAENLDLESWRVT